MPDELNEFQEYLNELYEICRAKTKRRNVSDNQFALWLGAKPSAYNHWINGYRKPDLISAIRISQTLGRHGVKDYMRIFDVLGYKRVYIAPTPDAEYLMEFWFDLPEDMRNEIEATIKQLRSKG